MGAHSPGAEGSWRWLTGSNLVGMRGGGRRICHFVLISLVPGGTSGLGMRGTPLGTCA